MQRHYAGLEANGHADQPRATLDVTVFEVGTMVVGVMGVVVMGVGVMSVGAVGVVVMGVGVVRLKARGRWRCQGGCRGGVALQAHTGNGVAHHQ